MYVVLGFRIGTWTTESGEVRPTRKIYLGQEFQAKPGEISSGVRAYAYTVKKASLKFNLSERTIYYWRSMYTGDPISRSLRLL